MNFISDVDKMRDFSRLSKEAFLQSYSYLSEEEYNNTKRIVRQIQETIQDIKAYKNANLIFLDNYEIDTLKNYYIDLCVMTEWDLYNISKFQEISKLFQNFKKQKGNLKLKGGY